MNLRKLNNDELYIVKQQVVWLKAQGKTREEIEALIGVNKSAVSRIWQSYIKGGLPALKPQVSGRKKAVIRF